MKPRPTIFLSGVSDEFASFRDAVEVEVQKKGCFAENQSSFGVDYHTVEEMLRRRISDADAVIHIVGFRFGAEPKDHKPRRSYTQMEYDIAHELKKPVYVFLSSDATVADTPGTDDSEAAALQLAHRQAVQDTNSLFYFFNDKAALSKLAGEIDAVTQVDFRVDISRIDRYAPAELIGRDDELALLNDAWLKVRRAESTRPHVLTFVAFGGEGKTSLVAKWLADLAFQNWPGCDSAFAWSFYSQGTRGQYTASSDLFLKEAITYFGDSVDKEFAASAVGAYEKGQRLAHMVGQRRSLLILDGVEPLQYSPSSPTRSELKDTGLVALLRGLAANSDGLCVVTTRYSIPNLKAYWQTTAPEVELLRLSREAGVHLLKTLGVRGMDNEFETLVEDVKGHALTLNLLGTYLRDAHGGDIRQRDSVDLEEAIEEQGGHAFRVIEAYENEFKNEGAKGKRALAMLRLLGLFDRPANGDCLSWLVEEPIIADLTEPLVGISETQSNINFKRLEDARLLIVNREASGALISVDAHPLLRDFFARRLQAQLPDAWCAAHQRLYERLRDTTPDNDTPSLEDLQPLYQAVMHGCQAGLYHEASDLYYKRILLGYESYSRNKLGAAGSELTLLARFFDAPWTQPSPTFPQGKRAWLLNEAAVCLRANGRLKEALEPICAGLNDYIKQEKWRFAARVGYNLIELEQTLGRLTDGLKDAERSVTYADRSTYEEERILLRTVHADVLHQINQRAEAVVHFAEAEKIQQQYTPNYPLLYAVQGFRYCDLLLSDAERDRWRWILTQESAVHSKAFRDISNRAVQSLRVGKKNNNLPVVSAAWDHLTLSRIALYEAMLGERQVSNSELKTTIDGVVSGLRRGGDITHLPAGLLTRSWLRFLDGRRTGPETAQEDLDEAWEIAERGPMKLHMADIHLYRARLFFREKDYPWESAKADLAAARKLIEQCGYRRRKEELDDAERVILK